MDDLKRQKQSIQNLMMRLTFPLDAQETFLDALDRIFSDQRASAGFQHLLQQYNESEHCNYFQMLTEAKEVGKMVDIHEYTISLLMFLCMSEKLRCRYLERGIDEEIWLNSLMDLRYKLEECRLVFGINGSFVAPWFSGFYDLSRFALGRLQFEVISLPERYESGEFTIPAGSKAINIHIPRTGTRLPHHEVLEAYRLADEMFADVFHSQPVIFVCQSWLLDPWILTVLRPQANLAAFCKDFKIIASHNYDGYGEMWRLFDCLCTEDLSNLPRDSSLRRAYAQRMERGEPVAWGIGAFIYRDGQILNQL